MAASVSECEALIRKMEKRDYGRFAVAFDVIFDVGADEFCVSMVAVNTRDADSPELPVVAVPPGWRIHEHWDWAQAAGAHVGTIRKVADED